MTIATTTTKVAYTGNGVITQWAVNFPITAREDVKAIVTTTQGVDTALQYGVDYSVSPTLPPGIGATVTTSQPVASGSKLTIYLSTPITQPADYVNSGFLDLEQAEDSYDRLTLICQQLAESISRAVKVGITSGISPDALIQQIIDASRTTTENASKVQIAMGNLFRFPIARFNTVSGTLDYTIQHEADPTSNNVWIVLGGVLQQPGVDFTLPNPTTIRFTSNPGNQVAWGFITLSASNPDIKAEVDSLVAAGKSDIQAFINSILPPNGAVAIAQGGTGATTASEARTNLGIGRGFSAIKSTNQGGIAPATYTKVTFPVEEWDISGWYDSANSRFQPTEAGYYSITAQVQVLSGLGAGAATRLALYKNGALPSPVINISDAYTISSSDVQTFLLVADVYASGTDYFEIYVRSDGGSAKTISSGATFFRALKIS